MRLSALRGALRARLIAAEDGYTMIAAIGAVSLISVLAAAALAASNGDLNLVQRNLDYKRAHAAAQAGIADYSYHLNNDNSYWARCAEVPEPNAVNQVGSTAKRRAVPGPAGASYAIELLPASGQASCNPKAAATSMLESGAVNTGTFRIRSTGFVGEAKVSIVATYKRASLLDYLYFTQYETMDPITYSGLAGWTAAMVSAAHTQCTKFRREGRHSQNIPGTSQECIPIQFITNDAVNGPLHTNDDLWICGEPKFGRSAADVIAVSAWEPGYHGASGCGTPNPQFLGPFVTTAPVLTPPPTNSKLRKIAGDYLFTGQTQITLSGNNVKIKVGAGTEVTKPIPPDGVIYVANGACNTSYSPYLSNEKMYPSTSGCGNAIVRGSYAGRLTVAAENDIIVDDDIIRTESGLLGLVANNFVRVYHPLSPVQNATGFTMKSADLTKVCNGTSNGTNWEKTKNLRIDAAILAIAHSFIVDHFNCGASLGTLTVNGAIAQRYRGSVGQASAGYIKNYNYDDRLRFQEPPNFLDPVEAAWSIQRETLDFPK